MAPSRVLAVCLLLQSSVVPMTSAAYDATTRTYSHTDDANLTSVPSDIPPDAVVVDLGNDAIVDFDSFPRLACLADLTLSYNRLTAFPDLSNVSVTLQFLFLANNFISQISPSLLSILSNLTSLQLSNNFLTTIPDVPLSNLSFLHIDGNSFAELPVMASIGRNIIHLNGGYQQMTSVSVESLQALPNLTVLYLESTKLTTMPPLMEANSGIVYLSLTRNDIAEIPDGFFTKLPKLVTLVLNSNNVTTVPDVCQSPIGDLSLGNNPIRCDERLVSLKVAALTKKISLFGLVCAAPTSVAGRSIDNVTLNELRAIRSEDSAFRSVLYTVRGSSFSCDKPNVTDIVLDVNRRTCAVLCTQSRRCDGWAYRDDQLKPGYGQCGLATWEEPARYDMSTFDVFYGATV